MARIWTVCQGPSDSVLAGSHVVSTVRSVASTSRPGAIHIWPEGPMGASGAGHRMRRTGSPHGPDLALQGCSACRPRDCSATRMSNTSDSISPSRPASATARPLPPTDGNHWVLESAGGNDPDAVVAGGCGVDAPKRRARLPCTPQEASGYWGVPPPREGLHHVAGFRYAPAAANTAQTPSGSAAHLTRPLRPDRLGEWPEDTHD